MSDLSEIRELANKTIQKDFLTIGSEPLVSDIKGCVPTGWTLLDYNMLGGFPMGRTAEVYGRESAGKTSLLLHAMANCQKAGGVVILFEPENTFPKELAQSMGVDTDRLMVISPKISLEDVFGFLVKTMNLIRKELPDVQILVVWDTMAATLTKKEWENDDDGGRMAGQYRATVIRRGMRLVTQSIAESAIAFVVLNHTFDSVDHRTGIVHTDTPGGRGVKFYASVRIHLKAGTYIKDGDKKDPIGVIVRAKFEKNKLGPPRKEVVCRFFYGKGFDDRWAIFDYATENEIIKRSGSWYSYGGTKFYASQWIDKITEDPKIFDEVRSAVLVHYATDTKI